jgi:hypothetical protein
MSTRSDCDQGIIVRSRAMKNILLVILSLALSIVVIEGFLVWKPEFQAAVPFDRRVFCDGPPGRMERHELFGWTEVPNSAYFEQQSEADGWAVHIYNADGFRDLFDSGDEHVIVLGDSFTRGALVNNDEIFPHLLDLWNPTLAFHNFGTGGYGTNNSLAIYDAMAPRIDHKLVILAYFLGNDLSDNLRQDGRPDDVSPTKGDGNAWYEALKEVNDSIRRVRIYNLLYGAVRSAFGRRDLTPEQIARGANLTGDLLSALAKKVKYNDADLLILVLPSWNQMNNYEDPESAVRQRAMLGNVVDKWDNVYMVDLTDTIARVGAKQVYGINDKHFSRYGHYLTAKVVHEWINMEWQRSPRPARQVPPFQAPSASVEPDCALMPEYREAFANPVASPGVSGRPIAAESGRPTPATLRLSRH